MCCGVYPAAGPAANLLRNRTNAATACQTISLLPILLSQNLPTNPTSSPRLNCPALPPKREAMGSRGDRRYDGRAAGDRPGGSRRIRRQATGDRSDRGLKGHCSVMAARSVCGCLTTKSCQHFQLVLYNTRSFMLPRKSSTYILRTPVPAPAPQQTPAYASIAAKYLMLSSIPPSIVHVGCHPSTSLAREMSGFLLGGSSTTASTNLISLFFGSGGVT